MKSLSLFFALVLIAGVLGIKAQQNVQVTAIFPKSFCQNYTSAKESSYKIEFQIAGLSDQEAQQFVSKSSKSDGVISFTLGNLQQGLRTAKAELTSQVDFDFFKTLLQESGVRFVNEEDQIVSISDWVSYTSEQCSKLSQLNQNIINIETKMFYTQQDATQRSLAESNGWFVEAAGFLSKAKEAKKNYLESIK